MSKSIKPIEEFFLESLLKICLISILIVMAVDFYFTGFTVTRSALIDSAILFAVVTAYIFYKNGYFSFAVIWIGFISMAAMFYQSIESDTITTSSMALIMVIGFGFSVLTKGKSPVLLNSITLFGMSLVFTWLALHPTQYGKQNANDIIVAGVTYCILFIIIAFSSWMLKQKYDKAFEDLAEKNLELIEKTNEIETQNEELMQGQENLYQLNINLERLVEERTRKVKEQNEQLIRYAYSNAHHLRGPVARVLGLIHLSKIDSDLDYPFLFQKIEEQTKEIDLVIKSINNELQSEV